MVYNQLIHPTTSFMPRFISPLRFANEFGHLAMIQYLVMKITSITAALFVVRMLKTCHDYFSIGQFCMSNIWVELCLWVFYWVAIWHWNSQSTHVPLFHSLSIVKSHIKTEICDKSSLFLTIQLHFFLFITIKYYNMADKNPWASFINMCV